MHTFSVSTTEVMNEQSVEIESRHQQRQQMA